jgi:signal transduction histidine kinase
MAVGSESLGDVLIVDDTPANLQLLTSMLKQGGYKARPVTSGALALRAAAAQLPDLILLDIHMPEMDGYEVCRRLKQDGRLRDVPVLFISASSEPVDKVQAFGVGAVDFVTKPFDMHEVQARIETHVRLRRARVELEQQHRTVAESYERLRASEALRDTLSHMIAHDMRSPLTGLLGSLGLLRMELGDKLDAESASDLERSLDAVQQLVRMLDDLLDVSRLEAGKLPIERSLWEVGTVCRAALQSLGAHARERRLDLSGVAPGTMAFGDEALMRRVLMNLLHNAFKFTSSGGAVAVRVERASDAIRIAVSDDGPGVPVEAREAIFEKFGQARLGPRERAHASGLGLTFCKMVLEAHGGSIGVEDAPGRGSTFWLRLPPG